MPPFSVAQLLFLPPERLLEAIGCLAPLVANFAMAKLASSRAFLVAPSKRDQFGLFLCSWKVASPCLWQPSLVERQPNPPTLQALFLATQSTNQFGPRAASGSLSLWWLSLVVTSNPNPPQAPISLAGGCAYNDIHEGLIRGLLPPTPACPPLYWDGNEYNYHHGIQLQR
jgi:hypothetical protein